MSGWCETAENYYCRFFCVEICPSSKVTRLGYSKHAVTQKLTSQGEYIRRATDVRDDDDTEEEEEDVEEDVLDENEEKEGDEDEDEDGEKVEEEVLEEGEEEEEESDIVRELLSKHSTWLGM